MLLLELALLLLISSTLSSAESFAYLFGLYVFVKIARSWLKGKVFTVLLTYDVLQIKYIIGFAIWSKQIIWCIIIIWGK